MLTCVSVPNLITGVSQQAPSMRLPTSADVMENAWPSVISGLNKRMPTEHIAKMSFLASSSVAGHIIDRDQTYQYLAIIFDGDLKVFDLAGNEKTVSFPDGKLYLNASDPTTAFRFLTIQDSTFVLNREYVVTATDGYEPIPNGGTRLSADTLGTVMVTQSAANSQYAVYINGVLKASYLTKNGTDAANSVEATPVIAASLTSQLTTAGYPSTAYGSTISISGLSLSDKITVTSTDGDKVMKSYRDTVQSFSDLPPNEKQGRLIKIRGDVKTHGDDYYVVFHDGLWVETAGYNQGGKLSVSTMPHLLVRNSDGTFTFKRNTWAERVAGDTESNKLPSFVNSKLNDIFLYTNRLGFLSQTNVILSEANTFENFFRTTIATLVDSDPIDFTVLAAAANDDSVRHAIPFNKDLLIMADRSQHRLQYNNYVGPKTLQIQYTTSFTCSPSIKPMNMGSSVYFMDDRFSYKYAKMFEYFPKMYVTQDDAQEITDPVPQYIPQGINFVTGSPRVSAAVLHSVNDPTALYLYKFYVAGDKKIQNSWSRWTFNDCLNIYWAKFSNNYLYLLIKRNATDLTLERIRCDEATFDPANGTTIMLDRYVTGSSLTVDYDEITDNSTVTLPYSTTSDIQVITSAEGYTNIQEIVTKVAPNKVEVIGDIRTHTIHAGIPYVFTFVFTQPYVRFPKGSGEVISMDGRFMMRYMTLEYHNTAYFKATLALSGRTPWTKVFDGKIANDPKVVWDKTPSSTGTFRMALAGPNSDLNVTLINDGPFNSSFGSAEWYGIYSPKARRL